MLRMLLTLTTVISRIETINEMLPGFFPSAEDIDDGAEPVREYWVLAVSRFSKFLRTSLELSKVG